MLIDGKQIAKKIIDDLKGQKKPDKALAAVLVDSASSPQVGSSLSFLKQKRKVADELGIEFNLFQFDENIGEEELIKDIEKLNEDKKIGGIIIQLPLPVKFNRDKIIAVLSPKKDVDALNPKTDLVLPPAVETVKDILNDKCYTLDDKVVAVVGAKGFLVGRPVSGYLKGKCKKLILLDMGDDLSAMKEADLIITGVGKAGLIKLEMLKSGAVVIDFGYGPAKRGPQNYADPPLPEATDGQGGTQNNAETKFVGDFDTSDGHNSSFIIHNSGFYTPTPGGTGPILVAELFKNFYKLNDRKWESRM